MKKITLILLLVSGLGWSQDYVVQSIGFNPPNSYTQTGSNLYMDDVFSDPIELNFDFNFYGTTYSKVRIGTNGVITFDLDGIDFCPYRFSIDIPDEEFPILNGILGVYHDMNLNNSVDGEITYGQYGTVPNRRFVLNFYRNPQFSYDCMTIESTIQVVLYETTNNIEVFIRDKPACPEWNYGNAVLGIINETGTEAIAAPGRQTSDSPWEAYNEAWRFSSFNGNQVEAYNSTFTICDMGNGGFESFNLDLVIPQVVENQTDVTVSFHATFLDANNNVNPLISPYTNTSNPQTIYARVEDSEGLYATSEVILQVVDCLNNDTDNDGVSSGNEDLNGDGNLDNDDTDNDGIPNYLDSDDDNDNVETIDEITGIGAGFGPATYTFIDTDNDGIENYLDNDDDDDGILSYQEDHNHNGTPIDDDINSNGIPDFLDTEVAILTIKDTSFEDFGIYPNPTSGEFFIQSKSLISETEIVIYDAQGKQLLSQSKIPLNGLIMVDVSSFKEGIYFVDISSEGNRKVKKLILN